MAEPKTICTKCDREILQRTADDNDGLCGVCFRDSQTPSVTHEYQVVPPDPIKLDVKVDLSKIQGSDSIIDWKRVEDALVLIASQYVQDFAKVHRKKTFYGFAFDCNADYGQVFICVNSPDALTTQAIDSKTRHPDLYGHISSQELENKLRWSLGDWEFQAFTTEGFSDVWQPIEEILVDSIPWEDDDELRIDAYRDAFMRTACRSMTRMEREGALEALPRTSDFKTFVADHDELDEDSWSRLESIRNESDAVD